MSIYAQLAPSFSDQGSAQLAALWANGAVTYALTGAGSSQANATTRSSVGVSPGAQHYLLGSGGVQVNSSPGSGVSSIALLQGGNQTNGSSAGPVYSTHRILGAPSVQRPTSPGDFLRDRQELGGVASNQANVSSISGVSSSHIVEGFFVVQTLAASVGFINSPRSTLGATTTQANTAAAGTLGPRELRAGSPTSLASTQSKPVISQHLVRCDPPHLKHSSSVSTVSQSQIIYGAGANQTSSSIYNLISGLDLTGRTYAVTGPVNVVLSGGDTRPGTLSGVVTFY